MLEELDKLREIGAQKIYEDTHISLKYVQSIIHESFEELTKVQFMGFVSILEREYSQDLPQLRKKGLEFFDEEINKNQRESTVLGTIEPKKNFTFVYIIIILLIFAAAAYYSFGYIQKKSPQKSIDNRAIESAKNNIKKSIVPLEDNSSLVIEQNITKTKEVNQSVKINKIEKMVPKKVIPKKVIAVKKDAPLIIHTRKRLWIGYINKTDNIKKQTVIQHDLTLDSSKTWLLSLGHGLVSMEVHAKKRRFNQVKTMFFIYKNGELKELKRAEFKKLNRGHLW